MDFGIIIKIGLVGLIMVIIDQLIRSSGKDHLANIITMGGVILMGIFVITLVTQLFNNVKTLFQF